MVRYSLDVTNWATGLGASASQIGPTGTFDIVVQLTAEGLERVEDVAERCFGMINLLCGGGEWPEYLIKEAQEMAEIESAKAVLIVKAPATGVVSEILVHEGDAVNPGQKLAVLECAD